VPARVAVNDRIRRYPWLASGGNCHETIKGHVEARGGRRGLNGLGSLSCVSSGASDAEHDVTARATAVPTMKIDRDMVSLLAFFLLVAPIRGIGKLVRKPSLLCYPVSDTRCIRVPFFDINIFELEACRRRAPFPVTVRRRRVLSFDAPCFARRENRRPRGHDTGPDEQIAEQRLGVEGTIRD